MAETAAQKRKRSAAAKKAAETRKKNEEAEEQEKAQSEAAADSEQNLAETDEARQGDAAEEQDTQQEVEDAEQDDRDPGPYVPRHRPLKNAGFDDKAAEEKRQAELAEERRVGLLRTAGKSVNEEQEGQDEKQKQEA
jgi:hypothetical protein